ncbi:hypothetical protein [Klebsiella michiganensis]|uniref:hypothetical protein n=1 Tax=Klebsiella michiganensis TaxID=1134687 RepID=UPI0015AF8FF9|nr:hypothetical protein [Klebsiella michiganensis]EKV4191792.1 hypothetical protein [Klebsiella michiganensis]MBN4044070.1 hypothetical protein [Klebsiella michiganensis]MDD9628989.1 hypothetical protein [Klebsiella michiganensis]MDD9636292.1 hypothetical protein [Klebsiella michiganensis]MDD9645430.1 hypothetical protein [Klebsiella michiganensis]
MVSQTAMLALAMVIIAYDLQPEDLDNAARQLAEYDAVSDANTEMKDVARN